MHRNCETCGTGQMFKKISLDFSDGNTMDFKLHEKNGEFWNEVIMPSKPITNFVNVTAKSVYEEGGLYPYNGFSEIFIFQSPRGNIR